MKQEPAQPLESEWHFVQELQAPLWTRHHWKPREAASDEVSLADGVTLARHFPDPQQRLETAYDDVETFLAAGDVSTTGEFRIETAPIETTVPETYRIEVNRDGARVLAGDSEGIRRGLFHLEEEMLRRGGPFLPPGEIERAPVIRTRISRCYFGPINRPPKNRDELADELNYYPDQYLNRLAHHGINGLWLTIKFSDLCPSRFFPQHGQDSARRLEKLRQTVQRCARYGIKIYVFCIEPRAFGDNAEYMSSPETLAVHPELGGHRSGGLTNFCTSGQSGQEYLEESVHHLFSSVPGLGGLIDINLGERPTHCYSSINSFFSNNCPRCSTRTPAEVFATTLGAMERGMHRAAPDAELISWLYVPYFSGLDEKTVAAAREQMAQIAGNAPPGVVMQVNFESHGVTEQCGREHQVRDYSLAYVGPSEVFAECARRAVASGARMSAKLQVGNSHEVATVPFVPVPGNLFRKYRKMRELGVSSVMQCWYFGNYPGVMTQAAGALAFDPLPADEEEFLRQLAATQWGEDAATVATAWQHFRDAYGQFPAALQFSWFGPVHDCIAWPLHLIPVDQTISPSWLLGFPPSGDRVAECFAYEYSMPEIVDICHRMAEEWRRGVLLLEAIKPRYAQQRERWTEIGVAQALGLQLQSAENVMRFYALREELPYLPPSQQTSHLAAMRAIVEEEIANSRRLAELARDDSRLGFHSEAEGYKYFPEKLAWRVEWLQTVLERDFPAVQRQIERGEPLFPTYTGEQPEGAVYSAPWYWQPQTPDWKQCPQARCEQSTPDGAEFGEAWSTRWQLAADAANLYVRVSCRAPRSVAGEENPKLAADDHVVVMLEPRRAWPTQKFFVGAHGQTWHENRTPSRDHRWRAEVQRDAEGWQAILTIPWECLRDADLGERPVRLNVSRSVPERGTLAWRAHQPLRRRLIFGDDNPQDYGWAIFQEQ